EEAIRHSKERVVFGRPLESRPHDACTIARMATRVHAARLARGEAARLMAEGGPFKQAAPMAQVNASAAAVACAHDASQIMGGYGFLNTSGVGRHYRDSKVLEVGEGTTEVQLMVISRELGLTGGGL